MNFEFSNLNSPRCRGGSILILALWTLFFLGALALAVGAHVSANLKLAGSLKARAVSLCLAAAGVERAIMEAMSASDTNVVEGLTAGCWNNNEEIFREAILEHGRFSVHYTVTSEADGSAGVVTNYGIVGEERKINVNKAKPELLASLIRNVGEKSLSDASEIASNIRTNPPAWEQGAAPGKKSAQGLTPAPASEYYYGSLYELPLVRDVDQELFVRIKPYLTVCGSGAINLNIADGVVLESLAECLMDLGWVTARDARGFAREIERVRPWRSWEEFYASSISTESKNNVRNIDKFVAGLVLRSSCFSGTAVGRAGNSGGYGTEAMGASDPFAESRVEFVADKEGNKLFWHEH